MLTVLARSRFQSRAALFGLLLAVSACSSSEEPPSPKPVAWMQIGANEDDAFASRVPGRVQAAQRSVLSFEVGGVVMNMSADLGDSVGSGAVLASLDAASYRLEVERARANLAESNARLAQARQDSDRQAVLFAEGAASEARLESARAQSESLQAIANANRAQLGIAVESLSDTRLRAPFGGRIARRLVEPGTQVSPGQPVFELDGRQLEVSFSVSSQLRERLSVGQTVTVTTGRGDARSSARITDIATRGTGPGAFEVVAALAANAPDVEAGEVVDVALPEATDEAERSSRIVVPLTAIMPDAEGAGHVWRIERETQAVQRVPVRLGSVEGDRIAILSGLRRGDMIVTKGVAFLTEGQRIDRIGTGSRRYAQ